MGLCKCPQRKVTNIFCYEHRVNVCEHCLMQNHPQCVVDTYKNWITDSLYSTKCGLCELELVKSETVRLLCFHIVHWDCLDSWARSLPDTTAPAGYNCPICKRMGLFPVMNQISPIADALRNKMGEVNWARAGLGLPLLDHEVTYPKNSLTYNGVNEGSHLHLNQNFPDSEFDRKSDVSGTGSHDGPTNTNSNSMSNFHRHSNAEVHSHSHHQNQPHMKLHESYGTGQNSYYYGEGNVGTEPFLPNASSRKPARPDFETPLLIDEDDKYRRRSPFESLSRWLRNLSTGGKRRTSRRRTALYVIVSIIVIVILLMFLFGRSNNDDDALNPRANPNLHMQFGQVKGAILRERNEDADT